MAKLNKTLSLTNAILDMENGTITEIIKDGEITYDLKEILTDWDGEDGISLTIKKSTDVEPSETGEED